VVVTDPPNGRAGGGSDAAGAATTPSDGSGRTPRPLATGPDTGASKAAATAPAPASSSFDASALSGLLGVGQAIPPASVDPAAPAPAPGELEAALAGHDHRSSLSSMVLLAVALLILLALAGGVAVRWWAGRPGRYWPA